MNPRTRIPALALLLSLSVLPGCFGPGPFEEPTSVYEVCGSTVDEVPDDATVIDASDRRIGDVEPVQLVVERARADPGSSHCVAVNESEYANVGDRLGETPLYDGDPHVSWGSNATGLYVAENGTVARVELGESTLG